MYAWFFVYHIHKCLMWMIGVPCIHSLAILNKGDQVLSLFPILYIDVNYTPSQHHLNLNQSK